MHIMVFFCCCCFFLSLLFKNNRNRAFGTENALKTFLLSIISLQAWSVAMKCHRHVITENLGPTLWPGTRGVLVQSQTVSLRFRGTSDAFITVSAGWAVLNALVPYQCPSRAHLLLGNWGRTGPNVSHKSQCETVKHAATEYWTNVPTQHCHHVQTHLSEDLPVFHLDNLGSNEEHDPDWHVTRTEHKRHRRSFIRRHNILLQGFFFLFFFPCK